ncbi:type IV pilus biogenesis/stability protein PilW [Thiohalophilus sp.]|uniref:type IV pilus biogenesis/stability protein PilW n=1 Tax=Thiohalophilus sp. TaxID=3028392 RepID=UPI002ACDA27E|nr:type IV pilus biogenesis/stability protein PilW [Thiohalophilus sp.]MDZ7663393.1 type IV pilus biogenesis/stability protein PilW [Thiohalophilus sp.]
MNRYLPFVLLIVSTLMLGACTTTSSKPDLSDERLREASELNAELGVKYMQQGDNERAMGKLQKAINYNDDNARAHHYLGELYRRVDRPDEAEQHFKAALDITPRDPSLLNNYAVLLCDLEKYDASDRYFEKALDDPVYSGKAGIYQNMAQCAESQNNLKQAEEYYLKALRLDPRLPNANLGMARLTFDMSLYTQSRQYLERFLERRKHNAQSLWLGILLERRAGNRNRVASYAMLLKGRFPDSEEARKLRKLERQGKL